MGSSGFSYKPRKNITIGEPGSAQQTSFGKLRVEALTPSAQGDFVYTINEKVFEIIHYAGGGSNSIDLSQLDLSYGAGRVVVIGFRSDDAVSDNTLSVNWFEQQ